MELQKFAEHEVADFHPCDTTFHRDKEVVFGEALRRWIAERAEWFCNTEYSVWNVLNQYRATFGNRENIKLQLCITFLTRVITALTVTVAVLNTRTAIATINAGSLSCPDEQ